MRIVAGAWRGRTLVAPPGQGTRPTADRVRQALFDMLMHAEWGGRQAIEGAAVLDVFAGTGALGLEALSRGAATACFIESDPAALKALRANVAACRAEDRTRVLGGDVFTTVSRPGLGRPSKNYATGGGKVVGGRTKSGHDTGGMGVIQPSSLVFLDPPYGRGLIPRAIAHLLRTGHIAPVALIIAETGQDESWLPDQPLLADRRHGAARMLAFRAPEDCNQVRHLS
nr:RsmD family RNA methyltransferase [uncultured Rhodopila sp.]